MLTPISPESEVSTFNESYLKIRNGKNDSKGGDEYESMDETDFPPPPPPLKSTLTVDYIAGASPLQKVFCCSDSNGTAVRLNRPGSAVQIHPVNEGVHKVGDKNDDDCTSPVNTPELDCGTISDNAPSPSQTSPAHLDILFSQPCDDEEQTDNSEHSLNAPSTQSAHGRFSPKTYNEMIKFVFTEHGIRVISDKEYVV